MQDCIKAAQHVMDPNSVTYLLFLHVNASLTEVHDATGAGDDEDEVAVLSANDCLPAEGRGEVMSMSEVERGICMLKLTQTFSRNTATTKSCLCFHSCRQLH